MKIQLYWSGDRQRKGYGMKLQTAIIMLIALAALSFCTGKNKDQRLAVSKDGKPVVEQYGQLQVIGTDICDQNGNPVQLRGMSSHGLQWSGKYANKNVLCWLRDDWNSQLWRSALYLTEGGYIAAPVLKDKMIESIEAAIDCGIYILVDWHVHRDRDPNAYKAEALEFFRGIAQKYGEYPNIIYEICNEPNGAEVTWSGQIKPYAEEVIAEIRKYDPDNIIVVGTPSYSQDVDKAADDPITGHKHIMYTLHFYAGSHGKALMDKAEYAMQKGLAVFVTEWGTTLNTGDQFRPKETLPWLEFMKKHNISWANWSVTNLGMDSGVLAFNADREGKGGWKPEDLSASGRFVRGVLRNENPKALVKQALKKK